MMTAAGAVSVRTWSRRRKAVIPRWIGARYGDVVAACLWKDVSRDKSCGSVITYEFRKRFPKSCGSVVTYENAVGHLEAQPNRMTSSAPAGHRSVALQVYKAQDDLHRLADCLMQESRLM
jgi:hypothetical protein